jgi:Ca-activated chloride channel family protein
MDSSRRSFLAILGGAAAIGGAIWVFGVRDPQVALPASVESLLETEDAVEVSIASSVTKQRWLDAAAAAFAASDVRTSNGSPIRITVSNVLSGESMIGIADETLQPVVWSPGEMAWVDQLTERWGRGHATPVMSQPCEPTVLTPVGLAMWRPMAEAMGWPGDPISWAELVALANDPKGWEAYGHPEWGQLRLGHTHPQYSSAGLLFMASVIYATTGKTADITPADIYAPDVETVLRLLAQNTAKYGMVTTDLLNNMARFGPSFLHVASAFEEGTVRFNVERGEELRWPLAFVFPEEGTFWSDHPYCILDGATWVSDEQAEAAKLFRDFLLTPEIQAKAGDTYIRPLDTTADPGALLTLANGTDPAASPATVPGFEIPSPDVSEAIIDQFLSTKRKATVLVVIDTSGSMNEDNRIGTATSATAEFVRRLAPDDQIGIVTFSDVVRIAVPLGPVEKIGDRAASAVLSLYANGGTNLHGAICGAASIMRQMRTRDEAGDDPRLYGIVLLSDGKNTNGEFSETRMFQECLAQGEGEEPVKIFAISFGGDADTPLLQRLAQETNGVMFTAEPASIGRVYLGISAEQ